MNTFSQIERILRIAILIVLATIVVVTVVSSRPGDVQFPFVTLNYQSYFLVWFAPFASLIMYTVAKNDTYAQIAAKIYGKQNFLKQLMRLNRGEDGRHRVLVIGEKYTSKRIKK